ncbi:hypothetical protein EYZ11_005058 [Aspergillus tanneri]|uniref:AB hydrolase-1 domain-containing protein n=1 Tax=Aspergillus tanneri TaxID=1220188 RepID=A0A4V3UPR5_9EURO|nr:uncharacterized protein ATNIH1004_006925 [Aspergillus tanneri]KAA8645506.1 hypothetical protein ATNIH1004_006925 [Aspergillus tanneri]THC95464.1 hypothetical protein EYZ11_005058 [Aspergillus tanneri]
MADPLNTLDTTPDGATSNLQPVSRKSYPIAGILTTVFGLDEIPPQATDIACLWLLHPRLATQERMAGIAAAIINGWNQKIQTNPGSQEPIKGLIAVAFDQRNHGSRLVNPLGNEAWRQGNPRHAQDMFSIFQGTARDVSLLIDYLPSFVFPNAERRILDNLVLGVSLGGHAAWSCILHEPRVSAGVVIIGCPDYVSLMADRARLSKLPSWTNSDPPGSQFLSSEAFPSTLLEAINKYDPAGLFLSCLSTGSDIGYLRDGLLGEPNEQEKQALRPHFTRCLAGKRILNLSGGLDKLVPYHRGEAFLTWLKRAIGPTGWFADGGVAFEDIIDESAAHEVTPKMVREAVRFINETLAASKNNAKTSGSVRESKI